MPISRDDCLGLDAADPLAALRQRFLLPPDVIYLDGNSLGALPSATPARLSQVIEHEWGDGLIRSWHEAGWIDAPRRVGAKIARLIGAADDEVICADSTSINLFKALACALRLQSRANPSRRVILTERGNFPTDLYIAQGLIDLSGGGHQLLSVDTAELPAALAAHRDQVAVLMLTHVNFQTGAMHDLNALTAQAHATGALTVWDFAHSAGAVPLDFNGAGVDFAVGCGYKYLNGGPGAPAFVAVARRHLDALDADPFAQPLAGWLGHRAPFAFEAGYAPAEGIGRFTAGTPSILALAALDCGVDTVLEAGVDALRRKSVSLSELMIALVDQRCAGLGLALASPRDCTVRGSQVCYRHALAGPAMRALISARPRAAIGDFRNPDILRFGLAPLYLSHADIWDAVEILRATLAGVAPPALPQESAPRCR